MAKNMKNFEVSPTLKDIQRELSLTKLVPNLSPEHSKMALLSPISHYFVIWICVMGFLTQLV